MRSTATQKGTRVLDQSTAIKQLEKTKTDYRIPKMKVIRIHEEIQLELEALKTAQTSLAEADHYCLCGSAPAPRSDHATANMVFFAHLPILEDLNHHQNLISSSLYHPGPLHNISSKSVHNFLSNVVHKQTNQRYQKHNLLLRRG